MTSRKVPEVDPNSLAASRTQRLNAGIPRHNFESGELSKTKLQSRAKHAENSAKASVTAEIEANPFTGDDTFARDPLPEFFPPTLTGDSELDVTNYNQARVDYLIHFLAIRDAVDLCSEVRSGEIGLEELEEMYEDPEVAAEFSGPSAPPAKGKGKEAVTPNSEAAHMAKTQPPHGLTKYIGITVEAVDRPVKAKYAPKNAPVDAPSAPRSTKRPSSHKNDNSRPPTNTPHRNGPPPDSNIEGANASQVVTPRHAPLHRTDSQTLVDGKRLLYPNYQSPRNSPHSTTSVPTGPSLVSGHNRTPPQSSARTSAPASLAYHRFDTSSPAHAEPPHCAPVPPNDPRVIPPQPAHRSSAPHASAPRVPSNARSDGEERATPPADRNVDEGEESGEEQEGEPQAKKPRKKVTGKVTIKSFPENQQPLITAMANIARARIIANGAYDDTAAEVAQYSNWPEEWPPRLSREQIVAQCLEVACAIAFGKASTVGAWYPEYFEEIPPMFLAYVCALIHSVIFAYRFGEHNGEHLNLGIQTEAFRRALRYLINMQNRQRNKLNSLCEATFKRCMEGLEPKNKVRNPMPEPEREWTPDIDEDSASPAGAGGNEETTGGDEEITGRDAGSKVYRAQEYVRIGHQAAGPSATYYNDPDRMDVNEQEGDDAGCD
ncbi:hypothetical protein FRC10_002604 [Ceratobasidium sp. 414]|nr:hypothetical protein FRC10_002604 [Ceratobasidium sp. 414]